VARARRLPRAGIALATMVLLTACYTSETAVLTAEDVHPIPGLSEGVYCHAENRLLPPQVSVSPQISEALGDNKCRDLHWDQERGSYVDRLSPSMVFRVGEIHLPELLLLQTQTGPEARARFAPLAVVDGMFLMFDPAGRWPEDIVEASGLELDAEGVLKATEPGDVNAALGKIWDRVIGQIRADVAFVEDADGPRLEFRRVDTAYSYIVYFRQDWSGDAARMRGAMVALADKLGLGRHTKSWTRHAP
jgi:hypothetical protein